MHNFHNWFRLLFILFSQPSAYSLNLLVRGTHNGNTAMNSDQPRNILFYILVLVIVLAGILWKIVHYVNNVHNY